MSEAWWVDLPFACFGITIVDGRVVEAPPIAKWMIGKTKGEAKRYILQKGGTWRGSVLRGSEEKA